MQPNDSVYGAIRLNLEGREPNGRIGVRHKRDVELWLVDRLHEFVNTDTGRPVVDSVHLTDDHYERVPGDPLADVIIEWNREGPINTIWSPATGVITAPYDQWRTGDHDRHGLLLVTGPGIVPGRRSDSISFTDVAPTLAASVGVDMAVDGIARADLVPTTVTPPRPSVRVPRPRLSDAPTRPTGRRMYRKPFDVPLDRWNQEYAIGLSRAIHGNHVALEDARAESASLAERVGELDHLAQIVQVGAWLRDVEVRDSVLISIVMPTRNRSRVIDRAIDSVRAQSYRNWELVVVDDASSDDTWSHLERLAELDARIRPLHLEEHGGMSRARNAGLDTAKGDLFAHLDDDNRFDAGWLRAIAWAFAEYPETEVCYGARVIDDDVRHRSLPGRSLPVIQFLPWDREEELRANRVDQNVLAHRATPERFDETLGVFNDWDFLLRLTDHRDPLPLPAIAAYYFTDVPNRMTDGFRGPREDAAYEYVQRRTRERRSAPA
jgi:hypothetical protein